jgi:hypothetical protein
VEVAVVSGAADSGVTREEKKEEGSVVDSGAVVIL